MLTKLDFTYLNNSYCLKNVGLGYLYYADTKTIYIAGNDDVLDWIFSLFTLQINHVYHAGFYLLACQIKAEVEHLDVQRIIGHSSGGAIGSILGEMLGVKVFTLGCPNFAYSSRIFESQLEYFENNVAHYQAKLDWITKIPLNMVCPGKKLKLSMTTDFFPHSLKDYQRLIIGVDSKLQDV